MNRTWPRRPSKRARKEAERFERLMRQAGEVAQNYLWSLVELKATIEVIPV